MLKSLLVIALTGLFVVPASLSAQSLKTKDGKDIPLTKDGWKKAAEKSQKERKERAEERKKDFAEKIEDKIEEKKEEAKAKREADQKARKDKANDKLKKIGLQLS